MIQYDKSINVNNIVYLRSTTSTKSDFIDISGLLCSTINYLEHVEVILTFSYTRYRGGTQLYLISPAGTKSNLLHHRKKDAEDNPSAGSLTWTFMSVHFWGETPIGNWTLQMSSTINSVKGKTLYQRHKISRIQGVTLYCMKTP